MMEFVFHSNVIQYSTKVFSVKGSLSNEFLIAIGQSKSWADPYEWTANDGFPMEFTPLVTTNFPIL